MQAGQAADLPSEQARLELRKLELAAETEKRRLEAEANEQRFRLKRHNTIMNAKGSMMSVPPLPLPSLTDDRAAAAAAAAERADNAAADERAFKLEMVTIKAQTDLARLTAGSRAGSLAGSVHDKQVSDDEIPAVSCQIQCGSGS